MVKYKSVFSLILMMAALGFQACENPNLPENVWNPDEVFLDNPTIAAVAPPDSTLAGVGILTITGTNFHSDYAKNIVYFNGIPGTTLEASADELVVRTANVIGDSVQIKVAVIGALQFGDFSAYYKLWPAVISYGPFGTENLWTLAVDDNENLFVSLTTPEPKNMIVKLTPDRPDSVIEFTTTYSINSSGMRTDANGSVYFVNIGNYIYIVPPEGGTGWSTKVLPGKARDFDFDSNGNLYGGGSDKKLFIARGDGTTGTAWDYGLANIIAVRVFDEYVYVASRSDSTATIQRHPIQDASGTLGNPEPVFDWRSFTAADGSKMLCMEFVEWGGEGYLFLGTNRKGYGLMILRPDGSFEAVYDAVVKAEVNYMAMGNGKYLYAINTPDPGKKPVILRIEVAKSAEPHYGRP